MYEITINEIKYNPASGWRIKKEVLENLIKDDRIHFPKKKGGNLYKNISI